MKYPLFFLLILLLLLPLGSLSAQSDGPSPFRCTTGDGRVISPRYDQASQRLIVVDWASSAEILTVENNLPPTNIEYMSWSPDCRFLLAELNQTEIVAWNILEGRRMGSIPNAQSFVPAYWASDSNYVLVQSTAGGYLWNFLNGGLFLLSDEIDSRGYNFVIYRYQRDYRDNLHFDLARHQLLAVPLSDDNAVRAYDLSTGRTRDYYDVDGRTDPVGFNLFGDEILVWSTDGPEDRMGVALWNRNTETDFQMDIIGGGGRVRYLAPKYLLRSPDGRYLILSMRDVYVWDMHNLPTASPHQPNVRFRTRSLVYPRLRFADGVTLDGVYWPDSVSVYLYRWNIVSGETLVQNYTGSGICANPDRYEFPADLMAWACELRPQR